VAKKFNFNDEGMFIFAFYTTCKFSYLLFINAQQNIIGHSIIVLPVVDSSNNYAMQQVYDGTAVHGQAFMALEQTKGKGQRGKVWQTGNAENIALSIVLEPIQLQLSHQFLLQTFITVSLVQWLQTKKQGFCIKWPNDIYFNDRKAAGILIENKIKGLQWQFAIIGIGINVNQQHFNDDLTNAISIQQILQQELDLFTLVNEICNQLQNNWIIFLGNPNSFLALYNTYLYKKNELVKFKQENKRFSCLIKRVTDDGILLCGENEEFTFNHGSVEWLL
jgi:BirA family transcriptional regulator, biotin operon repressor / biotin---[acetyl-CoA-carboxylase] ligase